MTAPEGPEGIDRANVEAWYRANIAGAEPPLHFDRLAGGHSNLTYRVTDANGAVTVLRRPPMGELLPSAHDMFREYRAISALAGTGVPGALAGGSARTFAVTGARFYVMGFVDGFVLHDHADVQAHLPEDRRDRAGRSLMEVAGRHAMRSTSTRSAWVDRASGEDYVTCQMNRWYRQYQASRAPRR
ncbi:MAG: phosphotransferase [Acidimicrobiales bacterium]